MTDDNNPEEKPSFFDSADEAKSWPPSEGYEVEESDIPDPVASAPTENNFEPDALDELLAEEDKVEEAPTIEPQEIAGTDYMDMLMHDFSNFDGDEKHSESSEEEFLVPINKEDLAQAEEEIDEEEEEEPETEVEEKFEQTIFAKDTDKVKIVDDDDEALSDIFNNNQIEESSIKENIKISSVTENSDDEDFDLDKYVQEKTGVTPYSDSDNREVDFVSVPHPITNSENSSGIIFDEPEEESKPFRTYASLDYGEEVLAEGGEEGASGLLAGINKNILILGAIVLAVVLYFGFTKLFNRKYETAGREKSERPTKEKRIVVEEKELVPLWEVSAQKTKNEAADRQLVQTIYKSSGRANPFAMPDSILADLQKAAELEMLKKQKPNTYRRLAYRATLVGVLTSNENTIALVNQQEATFDVLEGTSRNKILKLATKSMDKAKRDTQEMVVGSYIGPWLITKIESPDSVFSDAKVHIEFEGDKKILNMGKAEELGIFTEDGQIDSLNEPVGGSLDEDDFDDFEF